MAGREPGRRRPWLGLVAQAMVSKVESWGGSQLPKGKHLEKSSTLGSEHCLLPAGLGWATHREEVLQKTGMANTIRQSMGSTVVRILGTVGKDTRIN